MTVSAGQDGVRFSPVWRVLRQCRRHIVAAAAFSAMSNLLYLAPSLFMLQVYDRVLPSHGLGTLAALGLLTLVALGALAAFEWLRSRILIRASVLLEQGLSVRALRVALSRPGVARMQRSEATQNVDTLRQAMASPAVLAGLDAPWMPIYVIVGFLLHPALGIAMLVSAALLVALAWANERATAGPIERANKAQAIAYSRLSHGVAHAAEVRALGMVGTLSRRQLRDRHVAGQLQMTASFAGNGFSSTIKFVRLALQSGALALGAVLVIEDAISAGSVIAASLLMARALAPVEALVGSWRTIVQARVAYASLNDLLSDDAADPVERTRLPDPTGAVELDAVSVVAPHSGQPVLAGITAAIAPGQVIGIAGASGAGKSTLLRAIVGAATLDQGHVRLDGANRNDWDPDLLARHVGYLPQEAVLFPGTVKENIVRFHVGNADDSAALDAAAVASAQAIGAHAMIAGLPQGYDTVLGIGGTGLSGGQAQRVAIARALFGNPRILVLDEPTAHLDADSRRALARLVTTLRQSGRTIIVASHDADVLAACDKLMILSEGRIETFGPLGPSPKSRVAKPTSLAKA